METEQGSHETEESLILAQLRAAANNPDTPIATKIQNGSQSPEGPSPPINGEGNWNHYKALGSDAGINPMKRHRECSSPALVQGLFDQGSYINGELKQTLAGQSLLGLQQPKRQRPSDSDVNGEVDMISWDKKDGVGGGDSGDDVDFPELTKPAQFETKLDKRNCNFSNRDIFSLSRNNSKQMQMANGATVPPTSMEGTPGDLLEKTLSQYYPEQVSIAPQNSGGTQPAGNNGAHQLPSQARSSPSLTSGFPLSAPMPPSSEAQSGVAHGGGNSYSSATTPYMVNGYSHNSYGGGEHDQQQQQHRHQQRQQQQQSHHLQEAPGPDQDPSVGQPGQQGSGTGNGPHQNGTHCYPNEQNSEQEAFGKPSQVEFNQNHHQSTFPERQSPEEDVHEYGSFPSPGMTRPGQRGEDPGRGGQPNHHPQRGFQYSMQPQQSQHPSGGNLCGGDTLTSKGSMGPQGPLPQSQHGGADPGSQQQPRQPLCSNGTEDLGSVSPQMGWIDLNSSQTQTGCGGAEGRCGEIGSGGGEGRGGGSDRGVPQGQQQWRGFPAQPQPEKHPDPQAQMLEPDPARRFQTQGSFVNGSPGPGSFQQQEAQTAPARHNTAPEWPPQANSKGPHMQVTQQGQLEGQFSSQGCNQPPQGCNQPPQGCTQLPQGCTQPPQGCTQPPQVDGNFCTPSMQPEQHSCEGDPDLEDILSPSFIPPQQQQHLQQHQQQPHLPRPLSHPALYDNQQQIKSPNCRPQSQPQPGQQQQSRPGQAFPELSSRSSIPPLHSQPHQHDPNLFAYSSAGASGIQENYKFSKAEMQQYASSPGVNAPTQHSYPPQHPHPHRQPNHMDLPQSQPQAPQGMLCQQQHMYIKTEQQHPGSSESCSQFQQERTARGPPPPLCHPRLQGGDQQQRHAALRMHLLQRQEQQRLGHPPHPGDLRPGLRPVKMENGPRFEVPSGSLHHPQGQGELGMGGGMGAGVQIKQEPNTHYPVSSCEQSNSQRSILATMEQTLRQYQLSPVFERKSLNIMSPGKIKVESSGAVTILSTNTDLGGGGGRGEDAGPVFPTGGMKRHPDFTPKKEPLLQSFVDSPLKLLDTPIKNLLDTPIKTQYDIPSCHCVDQISEKDEGPYYTHLGAAPNVSTIREIMETRSGLTGKAIRIEKVVYTGKEGKSTQGCPIAKWVIRRGSREEKLLVLVRERSGHKCDTACIIVVILIWDGIATSTADRLYAELSDTLRKHGALTQRRCAINEERTCACQGLEQEACGASFSFGCSWSMYYNGCKFARSKIPRKFKLLGDDPREEEKLEQNLQNLATVMAPTYKILAPDAYANQVEHEHRAPDCRLGLQDGRPFSGVTACMDFCAHAHRDLHNMQGGSTVVCTLTREDNREIGKIPEDEQLHVLPLYKASNTDEFGSEEAQLEKVKSGAIQVLSSFRRQIRMLSEPAKSCRQKKLDAKKAAANKNAMMDTPNSKAEKAAMALQAKMKSSTYESSTAQNPPGPGLTPSSGQPPHPLGAHHQQLQQQQHQNALPPYPGSPHPAFHPRFPDHPSAFPSTSKPGSKYPLQQQAPANPYPSQLHVQNSPYMNGSNPAVGAYPGSLKPGSLNPGSLNPGSLNPGSPYPGYQCNGGVSLDTYHPYYTSNPKHMDLYRQQRPALYPEQQYAAHQRYGVNYPPRYGEPNLQVNGFSNCSMRPGSVHPMSPYPSYGPAGSADPQFLDALSRSPAGHPGLDYAAAVSKGSQFGGYPNPYLAQSQHMYPPGQDPFRMQIKTEVGLPPGAAGMGPQEFPPQMGGDCLTPTHPGFGLPNGGFQSPMIKQEPGTPQTPTTPTTPQKPEMWSDNEHNFLDPDIGGVAVAPSHGSILIECAKRELHATTPLKNPDRNHPTRISLVFYQHKNMNEAKHGLALWEAKMAEKAREKEEDAEKNGGEGTPSKSNKKGAKREHVEPTEPAGEPPYKRFIQSLMQGSHSFTTNTYVNTTPFAFTKVTGPYSKFV